MRFSKLLNINPRRTFDPASKEDQLELKYYMKNQKWKNGCPFFSEYPWEDIPAMCKDKYAGYMLMKVK